jgi:transcription termination/antitermination protein NusG
MAPEAARQDEEFRWYIVHTYSGFEERVKETLRQRADALGMVEDFGEIRIPT